MGILTLALASCSGGAGSGAGQTSVAPPPAPPGGGLTTAPGDVGLSLHLRVPAVSQATRPAGVEPPMKGVAVTVYQGAKAPANPTAVADISGGAQSNCAASADGSHLCTISLAVPTGTDTFVFSTYDQTPNAGQVRGNLILTGQLNGQTIATGQQNSLNVSLQGQAASVVLNPSAVVTVSNGAMHDYPVFLNAQDANGYFIVGGTALAAASVAVANDPVHTVSISPPVAGSTAGQYTVHYNGGTLNDARLSATVQGISRPATADVTPFNVAPATLNLSFTKGSAATLTASIALFAGPYHAVSSAPQICSVSDPVNGGNAAAAGGIVQFTVKPLSFGNCNILVQAQNATQAVSVNVVAGQPLSSLGTHIQHIVFIIQENRSFDNIFGGFDPNNGNKPFPGADTWSNPMGETTVPPNSLGTPVPMTVGSLTACYSPNHEHFDQVTAADNNKMDGFGSDIPQAFACPTYTAPPPPPNYSYQYLPEDTVDEYWKMAEQYAIADHAFEEISSASFTSHQYLIAAQAGNVIDNPSARPWGCDSPPGTTIPIYNESTGQIITTGGPFPCFSYRTMADNFDAVGMDWRYYAPMMNNFGYQWAAYDAISQIRLNDSVWNAHIILPSSQVLTDLSGTTAYLAPMTYVVPTLATSDHGRGGSPYGPPWVASVVNAIGESKYWNTTAIFVMWDDYGGFYDHVPLPPKTVTGLGYGLRVPVIVVSPYAKPHFVSHVLHSWGGMLKFTEEVFNLPTLGGVDAQEADDYSDMFDFNSPPQAFTPIPINNVDIREVIRAATEPGPPPDDDL
jgi:phospholipase C